MDKETIAYRLAAISSQGTPANGAAKMGYKVHLASKRLAKFKKHQMQKKAMDKLFDNATTPLKNNAIASAKNVSQSKMATRKGLSPVEYRNRNVAVKR